jgi:hypothetical protein
LLRYHHKVFRSPELQPAEKLVLIDANAAITWAEANGETTATELYIPARTQNVALSPKTYGRLLKKLHSCSALTRQEVRDDNGHTRVRIAATELTKDPLAIKRPEPSNWGGKRTPKCRLCGSEHFKPVAWECKGCGVTYDELPYPEEPDRDPEPPGPTPECPPPPTDNLSDMVNPQWGGTPEDNLSVGSQEVDDAELLETQEGGYVQDVDLDRQVVGRAEENAGDALEVMDLEASTPLGGDPDMSDTHVPQAQPDSPEDKLSVGVPQELRGHPQWVAWRPETTPDGRCVKPPYRLSNPRKRADVMDPATWGTYEEALAVAGERGGVGYVLTPDDPYSVIDLDSCRNPDTGQIEPAAAEVVRLLDSYTEISPSGKGLHVWLRGRIPGERRRKGKLEMYDRARYVTVTGQVLPGHTEIRERQEELGELYRRTFGDISGPPRRPQVPEQAPSAGDEEIIARMLADSEGRRLWAGDTSLHNDDPSRADLALLNRLARHTRDPERLDRLFRLSGLYRPKWERSDYRRRTIARALSGTPPGRSRGTPPVDPSGG